MIKNSKGTIFYGIHFYPGVAEYSEPGKDPYRVYLNEDTLRSMDPTFAGRPIFVEHVDEVDGDVDELRKDADGWVIESFYNSADGKHWVKFIVVSERGERAIANGMRLSNAYIPKSFGVGGLWNGVAYAKEITGGEYEHLAIVQHPRYEESVILTPDEFKQYNENNLLELKRLANSKEKKEKSKMGLNLFKRAKVENSADLEGMCVVLPKSKKEMTLVDLVSEMDTIKNMDGYASPDHVVKIHDGSEMKVSDLVAKHKAMNEEMDLLKKKKEDESADEDSDSSDVANADDDGDEDDKAKDDKKNEEDDKAKADKKNEEDEKKKADDEKKKNELDAKKKAAKEKAEKLKNAHLTAVEDDEVARVEFSADQVARGKSRYGSN